MTIAFCTTCKNRAMHVKQVLPQNLRDNPKSKFILLNYGTEDDLLEYLSAAHSEDIRAGRLAVYTYLDAPKFKIAHAKNMAHRLGIAEGADILVNMDADNFTGPGFEDFIQETFDRNGNVTLWANMVKGEMQRGISGRIALTSKAFLKVGGYDEAKFIHWGSDDKDLNIRLRDVGYEPVEIPAKYLAAVPHNDKIRFREYPHARHLSYHYFEVSRLTVTKAVVNNGNIGCGTVWKGLVPVRHPSYGTSVETEIEPIPTRIFGIGMHKTGTTSLHKALEILGYDSWHWSSAHAAKAIWREMNTARRSPTLERYHALCDLPIPMLYRQLDEAYPGSKFILTLRDEQEWLKAIERHFDPIYNRWQHTWDSDPFTHRVHEILYKKKEFHPEVFLARYRRHNAEVLEYFRGRRYDLLVMDRDGFGWGNLCRFLQRSVPAVPYPYENQTPQLPPLEKTIGSNRFSIGETND